MAGISRGANGIEKVAFGSAEIKKVSRGDTLIWQAVTLTAAGMNKNGVQTLPDTNRHRVTGWTVRPGFPQTVLDGDRIRIIGTGLVVVLAHVNFSGTSSSTVHSRWIVHNGVDVASQSASNQTNASLSPPTPIQVADGDYIWVDAQTSSTSFDRDDIVATSYITVTPVQ